MSSRGCPGPVLVELKGHIYSFDRAQCRRALLLLQVNGEMDTIAALAADVGVSRSTISRLFNSGRCSPAMLGRVLRRLELRFEDVYTPVTAPTLGA